MHISNFDLYRDLLKEKSGLTLSPDKCYLLESRLMPIARKWGYSSLDTLTMALRGVSNPDLISEVVEAMAVGDTSFFPDYKSYEFFKSRLLPRILERKSSPKKIRFWSTACASGQEPYSLAMMFRDMNIDYAGFKVEIIATDISSHSLELAKKGEYTDFEVQRGLPIRLLMKHFRHRKETWHLNDDVKRMVMFRYFNLLDSFSPLGKFDVVFCRNVLNLFEQDTQAAILQKMAQVIPEGGALFVGKNLDLSGLSDAFFTLDGQPGVYLRGK